MSELPHIERKAIDMFERQSLVVTGHIWDWAAASEDVKAIWRARARLDKYWPEKLEDE